ncbi:hypothetical protein MPNT_260009 [Candidatus Methylacidithermus pantelleriae]|uniref:Uncharacterized protein n=1 Tax=Candidatus Methylacidithermus pantelleriae TaxID=2744239 RepID=A0A8J2FNV2_9BACT|nr:hypothetical protein MPNT_260009 [Candidatus Methylacidithermus pantelleriae]
MKWDEQPRNVGKRITSSPAVACNGNPDKEGSSLERAFDTLLFPCVLPSDGRWSFAGRHNEGIPAPQSWQLGCKRENLWQRMADDPSLGQAREMIYTLLKIAAGKPLNLN